MFLWLYRAFWIDIYAEKSLYNKIPLYNKTLYNKIFLYDKTVQQNASPASPAGKNNEQTELHRQHDFHYICVAQLHVKKQLSTGKDLVGDVVFELISVNLLDLSVWSFIVSKNAPQGRNFHTTP